MFVAWMLTTAVSTGAALPQAPAISAHYRVVLSTPIYLTDGRTIGGSVGRGNLQSKRPITLFAYAGETLCAAGAPHEGDPGNAGNGWRVTLTPIHQTDDGHAVVVDVDAQRLWEKGARTNDGRRIRSTLTLKPGGRALLDYLGAAPSTACNAIGMALEVGLETTRDEPLVETELWLTYSAGGTFRTEKQTLRSRVSEVGEYYFTPIRSGAGTGSTTIEVSGRVTPTSASGDQLEIELLIGRTQIDAATGRRSGGSATYPLTVAQGTATKFVLPRSTFKTVGVELPELTVVVQSRVMR